MDKPITLSMRDYLVRKMAVKLMIPEKTIDAVIVHQFQSANTALATNDSVELSGFGKLLFNRKKAIKQLQNYKEMLGHYQRHLQASDLTEAKRNNIVARIASATEAIETLSTKLQTNEPLTDLRGMEEQIDSPQGAQSPDSSNQ